MFKEYQGERGYTIDFLRGQPRPFINNEAFGTDNEVVEFDYWAVLQRETYQITSAGMRCNSAAGTPHFGLAPSRFRPGSQQFSEAHVYVPSSTLVTSTWVGAAVYIGGDRVGGGTNVLNSYSILCERAGGGLSVYRLYRRSDNVYTILQFLTDGPDCAVRPVPLRIEARGTSDGIALRWWVDGIEQTPHLDTTTSRLSWESSVTGSGGRSFFGLHYGSGNAVNSDIRLVTRFRAGNLPERRNSSIIVSGMLPAVNITDVNGTESWTDGDTSLVITGTGFL